MSRRAVQPLTGDDIDRLPAACRRCLFWEQGRACPDRRAGDPLPAAATSRPAAPVAPAAPVVVPTPLPPDATARGGGADAAAHPDLVRKQAWTAARVQEGAPPGRVVTIDHEVVAYALFAPAACFARRGPLVPRTDPDALQLATVWVHPVHRGQGLGRLLLQAAIREAIRLDLRAVEAYADRRWREQACLLPVTWLLHEGLEVHREHPRTPLLRLDTRRTVRWAESLEHAWEEVVGRLPQRAPAPVVEQARGTPHP